MSTRRRLGRRVQPDSDDDMVDSDLVVSDLPQLNDSDNDLEMMDAPVKAAPVKRNGSGKQAKVKGKENNVNDENKKILRMVAVEGTFTFRSC